MEKWSGARFTSPRAECVHRIALMSETPPDQTWELDQIGNDRWGNAGGQKMGTIAKVFYQDVCLISDEEAYSATFQALNKNLLRTTDSPLSLRFLRLNALHDAR